MFEHLNRLLKLAEPLGQLATEAVTAAAPLLDLAPERLAEAMLRALLPREVGLAPGADGWWLASVTEQQLNSLLDRNVGGCAELGEHWRLTRVTLGPDGALGFGLRPIDRKARLLPSLRVEAQLTGLPITPTGAAMHIRLTRLDPDAGQAPVAAALGHLARLLALQLFEAGWLRRLVPGVRWEGQDAVVELAPGLVSPLYERKPAAFLPSALLGVMPPAWRALAERTGIEAFEFGAGSVEAGRLVLPVRLRAAP